MARVSPAHFTCAPRARPLHLRPAGSPGAKARVQLGWCRYHAAGRKEALTPPARRAAVRWAGPGDVGTGQSLHLLAQPTLHGASRERQPRARAAPSAVPGWRPPLRLPVARVSTSIHSQRPGTAPGAGGAAGPGRPCTWCTALWCWPRKRLSGARKRLSLRCALRETADRSPVRKSFRTAPARGSGYEENRAGTAPGCCGPRAGTAPGALSLHVDARLPAASATVGAGSRVAAPRTRVTASRRHSRCGKTHFLNSALLD